MKQKRYKLRTSAILALGAVLFGAAAISVQAIEPCQRLVARYVERIVPPHHYSKATLTRWAIWAKEHPDYHPPKRRPKLVPQETLSKIDFDCEVAPEPVLVAGMVAPTEFPDLVPPPTLVTVATAPPPTTPAISLVNEPLSVPPTSTGDVPEPRTWIYLLTGVAFLWLCTRRRFAFLMPAVEAGS